MIAQTGDRSASKLDLERSNRSTLSDETYEAAKALIISHGIPPGERVSIDALARDLQVSQTPVREALARLEADGLVVKEPMRGYRTTPLLTRRELNELYDMRRLMEGWAAKQAALRITPEGRQRLRMEMATTSAGLMAIEQTYKNIADHDARFHELMFELAGNEMLRAVWVRTHCHLHLFRLFYASGLATRALEEHHRVTEAIVAADPKAAEAAMVAHVEASRNRLLPATVED